MFHRGDFSFGGLDQEADTADIERRIANEMMLRIYTIRLKERGLFHTKKEEEIRAMLCEKMRRSIDCWLSCDEAKRWGFVDDVYTGDIAKLRAVKINKGRREQMWGAIRSKVTVRVIVK